MKHNRIAIAKILNTWTSMLVVMGMMGVMNVNAQRFRKVTQEAELVEGASYLLVARTEAGVCRAVKQAEEISLKEERRLSCDVKENAGGELELLESEAATFVLERGSGAGGKQRWYLKDEALQAYLCYNPEKITSTKFKACYTLPLTAVKGDLCREFLFDFQHPGAFLVTARTISYTLAVKKPYYMRMSDTSPFAFRLYPESAGLPLQLYKRVEEPRIVIDDLRGWTFKGVWTADSLCSLNASEASSIDFSNAVLPEDWAKKNLLWTNRALIYVLRGQVELLPQNMKHIVVLTKPSDALKGEEAAGYLLNPVEWSDQAYGHVKFAFQIPNDGMFRLRRSFVGDGGWESCALPFAFTVPWGWEVSLFCSVGVKGAEFVRVQPGQTVPAGVACLVRCTEQHSGPFEYTFEAKQQTVPQAKDVWQVVDETTEAGYYGVDDVWTIGATKGTVYLLNAKGTAFVRALPGSRLSAWKAFLYVPQGVGEVKIHHTLDDVTEIGTRSETRAVYSLNGTWLLGPTASEKQLQGLPRGIYILRENGKSRLWTK